MNQILEIFKQYYIYILIVVFVLFILIFLLKRNKKIKKLAQELKNDEVKYNKLKSVPLVFKLNKAIAIAKANDEMIKEVDICKEDYEYAKKNIAEISRLLIETQDYLEVHKIKEVKANLLNLDSIIDLSNTQISKLELQLNVILEKEAEQRNRITNLKQKYQTIKLDINIKQQQLGFVENAILQLCKDIEEKFSAFEEWMYLSEYEKSAQEITNVEKLINQLEDAVNNLPEMITDTKVLIPNLIDELKSDYAVSKQRRVYVQHLEVEKNIEVIEEALKVDLQHIQRCDLEGIKENIVDIKERLLQMRQAIKRENEAFTELKDVVKNTKIILKEINDNIEFVKTEKAAVINKVKPLVFVADIPKVTTNRKEAIAYQAKLDKLFASNNLPSSTILASYNELYSNLELLNNKLISDRNLITSITNDELHAKEQLQKLQIIMNEMHVKISKNKLSQISSRYKQDMQKAKGYVYTIKKILNNTPMDIKLLTSTVEEAIDYVYRLYNNVNNVVGMAIMAENTIVFGNKYRSENDGVDSDLTKAELFYHNGQYTKSLKIAIDAIEKVFPNDFDKVIKEQLSEQ